MVCCACGCGTRSGFREPCSNETDLCAGGLRGCDVSGGCGPAADFEVVVGWFSSESMVVRVLLGRGVSIPLRAAPLRVAGQEIIERSRTRRSMQACQCAASNKIGGTANDVGRGRRARACVRSMRLSLSPCKCERGQRRGVEFWVGRIVWNNGADGRVMRVSDRFPQMASIVCVSAEVKFDLLCFHDHEAVARV